MKLELDPFGSDLGGIVTCVRPGFHIPHLRDEPRPLIRTEADHHLAVWGFQRDREGLAVFAPVDLYRTFEILKPKRVHFMFFVFDDR